jgi:hypothetical protein
VLSLGQVYLSDVLGGVTLGSVWGLAVATAVTTVWRLPSAQIESVDADPVEVATPTSAVPHTESLKGSTPV